MKGRLVGRKVGRKVKTYGGGVGDSWLLGITFTRDLLGDVLDCFHFD